MWTYEDEDGGRWDVVLGRESWGALYALFVPKQEGLVRQTPLSADSYAAAQAEVDGGGREGLERLFRSSMPKKE